MGELGDIKVTYGLKEGHDSSIPKDWKQECLLANTEATVRRPVSAVTEARPGAMSVSTSVFLLCI